MKERTISKDIFFQYCYNESNCYIIVVTWYFWTDAEKELPIMFHMYAIPTNPASQHYTGHFRMRYLTNTAADKTGSGRTIHCHAEVAEIALIYDGCGVHSIGNRRYNSEPGDLLIYNANVLHQDFSTSADSVKFFLCAISGLQINGQAPGIITANPDCFLLKSGIYSEFLLQGFQVLEKCLQERSPNVGPMSQGFLVTLLSIVTELCAHSERTSDAPHMEEMPLAEKIRTYIDYNYTSNFSLADLAESLHISRYHASHIFSETYGVSIIHYRTLRRIGEAQSLLTSSDESITRIASNVGYDDPNQFSQTFAKIVGMPPSKYRSLSVWSRRNYGGKKEPQ